MASRSTRCTVYALACTHAPTSSLLACLLACLRALRHRSGARRSVQHVARRTRCPSLAARQPLSRTAHAALTCGMSRDDAARLHRSCGLCSHSMPARPSANAAPGRRPLRSIHHGRCLYGRCLWPLPLAAALGRQAASCATGVTSSRATWPSAARAERGSHRLRRPPPPTQAAATQAAAASMPPPAAGAAGGPSVARERRAGGRPSSGGAGG